MISIEEVNIILDEIAETLPKEFYNKLNGGIILLPQFKIHSESKGDNLYIMGEYNYNTLGRYITIYYGSFEKVYGSLDRNGLKEKLRKTLLHEFTHHIEHLAGEKNLEIKDKIKLEKYKNNLKKKSI